MRTILGGKAEDEFNKLLSPKQQNKILFRIMVMLILAGCLYILSFYL